jgi:predicted transcriptional regulator
MSTIDIRKELHNYIDNSTDDIIAAVYAMLKTYNKDSNEVVDIQEYNNDIEQAMKEMDNGEFVSHEDAKKALFK